MNDLEVIDTYYKKLAEQPVSPRRPLRFLVIDDDENWNHLVQQTFARKGLTVDTALSATEGLMKACHRPAPYTLILLDVKGIGKPVYEVVRLLQRDAPLTHLAIVTGYSGDEDIQKAMDHGPFWLVQKPMEVGKLADIFIKYQALVAPEKV